VEDKTKIQEQLSIAPVEDTTKIPEQLQVTLVENKTTTQKSQHKYPSRR